MCHVSCVMLWLCVVCHVLFKDDTVVVLVVTPRYYHGNGYNLYGITAVLGPKYAGFSWGWRPVLQYYRGYGAEFFSRLSLKTV